jgi:hypothetical protein
MALNKSRYTAILRHSSGERLKNVPVNVYQTGTTTKVTIYQSATSSTTTDNPPWTDSEGRLTFFCTPQVVDLVGDRYAEYGVPVQADVDQVEALAGLPVVVAQWYISGGLSAAGFAQKIPAPFAATLTGVRLAIGTAPVGAAILVDVNKAGTSIFTTQGNRPTIADGATSGGPGTAPDVTSVAAGDLLAIDVDQVGSGTAGSNLTVQVLGVPVLT